MSYKETVDDFCMRMTNEFGPVFSYELISNIIAFSYDSMSIVIKELEETNDSSPYDYNEKDLIDSLCRVRFIILDRQQRNLPKDVRNEFYNDLDIKLLQEKPVVFKTDNATELVITYPMK